jgi:hypothetical protein
VQEKEGRRNATRATKEGGRGQRLENEEGRNCPVALAPHHLEPCLP